MPQDGRLVYLETPATIWQAEAVLFDEVSRCRPELQNKLFPLIHEKVAQGIPLTRLKHRWAAMNPPPQQGARSTFEYEGAEPLDVALADRFAFVLEAPSLDQLSEDDRRQILRGQGRPDQDAARKLQEAVESTKEKLAEAERELRAKAAEYVDVLAAKLAAAGHPLSTRRAVTLVRNIEATRAAESALESEPKDLEDSFYSAARTSLPDAAWGRPVEGHVLLAAHKAAWEAAKLQKDAPERALLVETDPLKRIALALTLDLPRRRSRRRHRRRLLRPLAPRAPRHLGGPLPPPRQKARPPRKRHRSRGRRLRHDSAQQPPVRRRAARAATTGSATSSAPSSPSSTPRAPATRSSRTPPSC